MCRSYSQSGSSSDQDFGGIIVAGLVSGCCSNQMERKGRASRLCVGMISRIEDVIIKEILGFSADRDDPPYHKLSMIETNPDLGTTHVTIQEFHKRLFTTSAAPILYFVQ